MNFSRKTILVVGAALLAAACGDKITVKEYPVTPPAAKVNFVEVTPATATLNVGQTITLTAAVNADAGLATTVTWAASASNVTVSSAGVVTAVSATPGVAVCATSTVDTGKKGCAQIVVAAAAPTIPATVSINSVTSTATGLSVLNGAATNNIDVLVNYSAGNQSVQRIVLVVGGIRVDSQLFSAAQAAALRYASDEAIANQSALPQILFTVNTAFYNAAGVPRWYNGAQGIQALLYVAGTSTAVSATAQANVNFANVNTYVLNTSGLTSAVSTTNGYKYSTGSIAATVIPVIYTSSALQMASGNLTFGVVGCDNSLPGSARTLALTVASGQGTVTFTKATGAAGAGDFKSYEINTAGCGSLNTGEGFTLTAMDNAGNQLFAAAAPANNVANLYRIDNVAPAAPVVKLNPNGRANLWVNDAVSFVTVGTATGNGMINAAVTDAGIGGVTYAAKVGATLTTAKAASDITTPATLAASSTNADYCLLQYSVDAIGNRSADPAACATTLGVDRAAPTIRYTTGTLPDPVSIAANSRYAAAPGADFNVAVNDTGLVGNSGMAPAAPVKGTVIFRGNGNTAAQACFVGTIVSSVCTANTLAGAAPYYGTTTVSTTAGNTVGTEGYYTFTATAYDAAGNSATVSSRTTLVDATAATVGTASAPLSSTTYTFPVSALINENLDIQNYFFNANYAAATGPFTAPTVLTASNVTAVNGYDAATFINTNYSASTTFNLPVNIQANMGALASAVTGVSLVATNQANTTTAGVASGVPAFGTAPTAISTTNMTGFTAAVLPAGKTGLSSGLSTAATTAKPLSSTLSVTTTGATAVFNNPFARVDFYGLNVAGTAWVFLGSTTVGSLTDDGATRTFTYSVSIDGATAFNKLGGTTLSITQNVIAFGVKADGSVAMVNVGALALNIVY